MSSRRDLYQSVTDQILAMLDKGTVPWHHPIRGGADNDLPRNLDTNKPYRGVNCFLLAITSWVKGDASPRWLTYRQAAARGGHVKAGEKSTLVVFWKQYATTDKHSGEPTHVPVLRHFNVFNTDQCAGLRLNEALLEPPAPFEPIAEAQKIVAGYVNGPRIEHSGGRAYYSPKADLVMMPEPEKFLSREFYYATLFHELGHSTGHSSRLDRGLDRDLAPFGSPDYSREELIAEMASAFLSATAGISLPTIEQSAAYIEGWRKRLTSDRKLIVSAAGAGQRAADYITGWSSC